MKLLITRTLGLLLAGLLVLLLSGPNAQAQAPAWQMAMGLSQATGVSRVTNIATDASGAVYMVGAFYGTVSFGATSFSGTSTPYTMYQEGFVAKWSPLTNSFVWAQPLGHGGSCQATAVAVSGTSVYVAGNFSGSGTFGTTTLTGLGSTEAFVMKLTDAGSTASPGWALRAGAQYYNSITALTTNGTSVYATGKFNGASADFGSRVGLTNPIPSAFAGYVAKLTDAGSTGSFAWASLLGGPADAVAISGSSVYLAGGFGGTRTFGSSTITSSGPESAYVARLNDTGAGATVAWVQQAGGPNSLVAHAYALAVRGSNVYLAGGFGGAVGGSSVSFGAIGLTSFDYKSVFVAKLTDAGTSASFAWALRAGGRAATGGYAQDSATALIVRGASVYIAGGFSSPVASFGSSTIANGSNSSGGNLYGDVFVARLTDAGSNASFDWAQQAGGPGRDGATSISLVGAGIYVGGSMFSQATFGNLNVATTSSYVGFLAYLSDPTLTGTTAAQSTLAFTLAPNPARSAANVLLPAVPGATTATLTLTDALGRVVRTEVVNLPAAGLRHELDLRSLAPGLYAVQVRAGRTSGTQRLVVE